MDFFVILSFAIPIVLIAGLIFYCARKLIRWTDNNHSEVIKYELKITEKKEKYALLGAAAANGLSNEISPKRYYFTGETKDGQVIKGQVPFDVYDRLREDSRCFITMRGTSFIAFERIDENDENG